MKTENKNFYTVRDVAKVLKVSPKTLKKWNQNGTLTALTFGNRPRYDIATINKIATEGIQPRKS